MNLDIGYWDLFGICILNIEIYPRMSNKTLYLEATGEKNRLKIGLHKPDDVIWRYEDLQAPLDRIKERCESMLEAMNMAARKGRDSQVFEKLKSEGRILCDELLTPNIREKLCKSDAVYLILKLDDHLVHIPWELLCIDQEFLNQRFCTGRLVKTRQNIAENNCSRKLAKPLHMWILANPGNDLPWAGSEGLKIFQDMAGMNQQEDIIEPYLDGEVTPDDIKSEIRNYDLVHFAGHGDFHTQTHSKNPGQSGWRLSGGSLTSGDIDKMAGNGAMPALVFSNACQSARTDEWKWEENAEQGSFGLANAFLRAGVKHYIGTFWEITDLPGSHFAHEFYENLRSGAAIGQAVRQGRTKLTDQYGPDICWASYLLYGDPRAVYFDKNKEPEKKAEPEPAVSQQSATRGSFFNYALNTAKLKEMQTWPVFFLAVIILVSGAVACNVIIKEIKSYRQMKIREFLTEQAEKKQKKTEQLFKELIRIAGSPAPADKPVNKQAEPLTMAMVFDSQTVRQDKEKLILFAIQNQVINSQNTVKLLERESFDLILEELIRKAGLNTSENRMPINLHIPKFMLIIEICESANSDILVLMRLTHTETGILIDNLFEELDSDKPVLAQKKKLSENLLKKLKSLELKFEA